MDAESKKLWSSLVKSLSKEDAKKMKCSLCQKAIKELCPLCPLYKKEETQE